MLRAFSTAFQFSKMSSNRPIYESMKKKITEALSPSILEIVDESASHAEHEAMRENGYLETHFKVLVVSEVFKPKMPVQRHRMVYALLDDEFKNGLHAINIVTRTPEEHSKAE